MTEREFIIAIIEQETRTFGGGRSSTWGNPIADATKECPLMFAAGVDVAKVVDLVFRAQAAYPAFAQFDKKFNEVVK